MKEISIKHKRAADYYLTNGFNKTEAMLSAGYATKYTNQNVGKVFDREEVKAYIQEKLDEADEEFAIKRKDILSRQNNISTAFDELLVSVLSEKDEDIRFAKLLKVLKASDSTRADEVLARMLGFNEPDKLDVNITDYKANFGS